MKTINSQIIVIFRYDAYNGNGYYWRFRDGSWHGPFDSKDQARAAGEGFWA